MVKKQGSKQECPNCGGWFVNLGTHQRFCGEKDDREEKVNNDMEIINGRSSCCMAKIKTYYSGQRGDKNREVWKICKKCGNKKRKR